MNMSTTLDTDETDTVSHDEKPGAKLKALREKAGHSTEYVANKLHLRVRVIELLEADAYDEMPEPVFIKGYLRAYANLLEVDSIPMLELFNNYCPEADVSSERALWQSRKETNKTEHWIRWATGAFALVVLVAVFWWWNKNKDVESLFSAHVRVAENKQESEVRLTDLSNMRSLLSAKQEQLPSLELKDE